MTSSSANPPSAVLFSLARREFDRTRKAFLEANRSATLISGSVGEIPGVRRPDPPSFFRHRIRLDLPSSVRAKYSSATAFIFDDMIPLLPVLIYEQLDRAAVPLASRTRRLRGAARAVDPCSEGEILVGNPKLERVRREACRC